jgi:hypothetical protein
LNICSIIRVILADASNDVGVDEADALGEGIENDVFTEKRDAFDSF